MNKYCSIDFEYRGTSEARLDLICASLTFEDHVEEYWLRDDKLTLKNRLKELRETHVFLVWNYIAEGQSFISLNLNPVKFKVVDLQIEYKMLLNHYHKYSTGKHLYKGKVYNVAKPKYGDARSQQVTASLTAGVFKLLDVIIDTEHKEEMRKICIYGTPEELEENKKDIMDYCTSDTKYLKPMWDVIRREYKSYFLKKDDDVKYEHVFWRSETMARTALMTSLGYPVDVKKMTNFSNNVKPLLRELCEDINSQFDYDLFKWNNKEQRYSKDTKMMAKLILENHSDIWARTPKGGVSLKTDEFEKHFHFRHDYPRGNPFAQYLRYLKTQRSLNGFLPKGTTAKNKETIFDSLGSDERVRAYINPYGSQSGRYQPKAVAYIPLKSAWMRSLIAPKKGRAIASIDYKSEEFLLGGLVSGDKNMLDAYKSGDVYLHFAKLAGAVPWDGTKAEYKKERNLFKATTLGISYLMGAEALGRKLSGDTGENITTAKATELIRKFRLAYPRYTKWQDAAYYNYSRIHEYWMLPCGFTMFGDNPNQRSVKNMPIQGIGSSILRKAIALSQDAGLKVIFPLHDALYIEYPSDDLSHVDTLKRCMREAFAFYFEGRIKQLANDLIGFDVDVWSPDYTNGTAITPGGVECKQQEIYIDERSVSEYNKFKKYMESE